MCRRLTSTYSFKHRLRLPQTNAAVQVSGFTLVELVFAVGLVGLLAVGASWFWLAGFDLARSSNAQSAALSEGQIALERLSRELREVKYDGTSGAYCVDVGTWSASRLLFNKNKSSASSGLGCGLASPTPATDDIAVTIERPVGSNSVLLAYSASPAISRAVTTVATGFEMQYLQHNMSNVATTAANLRFIRLKLTIQPNGGQSTDLVTLIALRNN